MSEQLLRLDAVVSRTGLSRSALYRAMDAGEFPRPVQLTKRLVAWPASEVDLWVEQQIAARNSSSLTNTPTGVHSHA